MAAFLAAMAILCTAAAGIGATIRLGKINLQKAPIEAAGGVKFHTLPTAFPGWNRQGEDAISSKEVVEELGTENYLSRWYIETEPEDKERPRAFELHCAYYTGTIDTVPHVPERCFVGGGMRAVETTTVPVPLDLSRFPPDRYVDEATHGGVIRTGRALEGRMVHMPRDLEGLRMNVTKFADPRGLEVFAGYFFLANGGHVPTANDVRQLAFKLQDSYAYYAKVQFLSAQVESAEGLAALAAEALNELFPDIMSRTPDWVDVVEGRYPPTEGAGGMTGGAGL